MSGIGQAQIDGGVLVAGAILFFIGAGLPPEPSRVFSTPTLEHLRIVGRNAPRWRLMNLFMIAGVLVTGTGLWVIAPHLGYRGVAAAGAYAAAAPLWLVWLASRATIEIAAAEEAERGGSVPAWWAPWEMLGGLLFRTYMIVAYIAVAVDGLALVRAHFVAGAGWFALVFGLVGAGSLAARFPSTRLWGPVFEPPFLIHVAPLVIGIALLLR